MIKDMKFKTKLLLTILLVSIAGMITVSAVSYAELRGLSDFSQNVNIELGEFASENSKTALISQAEEYLLRLSSVQAEKCNEILRRIENDVCAMAYYTESLYANADNFVGRELPLPNETSPETASAKIMIAPNTPITRELKSELLLVSNTEYMFGAVSEVNPMLYNSYVGTKSGIFCRYSESNDYDPAYDPRERPWYTAALISDTPVWLNVYTDVYSEVMTTCAMSFGDKDGNIAGVVGTDVLFSSIVSDVINMRIEETGFAFIVDGEGNFLAQPGHADTNIPNLPEIMKITGAIKKITVDTTDKYVIFAPLETTGWTLGIIIDESEIVSDALDMKKNIDTLAYETEKNISTMLDKVVFQFIALLGISVLLVIVLSVLFARTVTKPIIKLTEKVTKVGNGDLDSKIEVKSKDEIGLLADSFNKMTDDLKSYIDNLSKVTAEKERISTELDVAKQIQADMLPNIFPAFPERTEFDIYAAMQPAKEVGGDFYDFFMVDDNHLGIVVADVSGKGVPAALFMVIAKTLINNRTRSGELPENVFTNVNTGLCEGNESGMFVTAWMGVLEIDTGKLTFVNAGHNPPLIRRANKSFEYLRTKSGFILAGLDGMRYKQQEIILEHGDTLFLYTDGITEANNAANELYGEERLRLTLDSLADESLTRMLSEVKADVDAFADTAPQFDDITMLAVKMN